LSLGASPPLRVLIVKLSSLGDVVHAMAAVQDLLRAHPAAQVDWVVERAFAPVVARCAGVHRTIPCELRTWRKRPFASSTRKAWSAFKADLQRDAYDAVIDLQGLSKSALVAWLAQTRVGGLRYAMANRTEGSGYEAPTRWVADRAIALVPHVHAVQRSRLLCAQALGYALQGEARFGLSPQGPGAVRPAGVSARPLVALVHGTSRADKEWPLAHWISLGQRLNQQGFCVALAHGSAAEQAVSEAIAAQLADAWVWPRLALDTLVDTMAGCAGVIGVDSGLSHIAVALGLPHVQLYNFDTAWRTGVATAHQVCIHGSPVPALEAVWQAWEGLALPVVSR